MYTLPYIIIILFIFNFLLQEKPNEGEKFVAETLKKLTFTNNLHESVNTSDLVVEAIVENLDIKHKLFSDIDKVSKNCSCLKLKFFLNNIGVINT